MGLLLRPLSVVGCITWMCMGVGGREMGVGGRDRITERIFMKFCMGLLLHPLSVVDCITWTCMGVVGVKWAWHGRGWACQY